MNKINKFLALGLVLIFASCESFINGVDEVDPTTPIDANPELMLNGLAPSYAAVLQGDLNRIAGIWTGQFSGEDRQYSGYQNYINTAGDFDATWGGVYSSVVQQTRIIRAKTEETNNRKMRGMAQIIEAHVLGMAAAAWGDIPFDEAGDFENFPNPTYEPQTQVYGKVIAMLDDAIANLESGIGNFTNTSRDIFYNGDSDKWIRAAYTLKAKFNLHLGNYTEALAAAEMGINDPAENLIITHGESHLQNFNLFYSFLEYDRPGYMGANAFAANLVHPDGDNNRSNDKTNEAGRGNYLFMNYQFYTGGFEPNFQSTATFYTEDGYFGAATSFELVSYRENELIKAECQLRNGNFDGALATLNNYRAWLNAGGYINPFYIENFGSSYEAYETADFEAGGIENADGVGTNEALYREIIEEKYISLVGHMEVFNDLRRSGMGSFASQQNWQVLGITPNTGSEIPQRFLYSQNEINSNENTPSPIPGMFDKTAVFQ